MTQGIDSIYADVMEFVARAQQASNDDVVPMGALEVNIETLTTAINGLPLKERLTHQLKLEKLSEVLKQLETKLRAKREAIVAELESQPTQRKAHAAYSKTDKLEG